MNEEVVSESDSANHNCYHSERYAFGKLQPRFDCLSCGYDLRGLTIGENCPECGKQISLVYESDMPASAFATWSLVFGIVAFPSCVLFGIGTFVSGILAIVFWWLARKQVREHRRSASSMNAANAGLICAITAMAFIAGLWITAILP